MKTLGSTDLLEWEEGLRLCKNLKFEVPTLTESILSKRLPEASEEAVRMITLMLSLDPNKRPTISQLLDSPFFHDDDEVLHLPILGDSPKLNIRKSIEKLSNQSQHKYVGELEESQNFNSIKNKKTRMSK